MQQGAPDISVLLCFNPRNIMSSEELYLLYHGLMLPKDIHSFESLKFAHEFTFKDEDVTVVVYPKSGQCFRKTSCFGLTELMLTNTISVVIIVSSHIKTKPEQVADLEMFPRL